MKDFTARFLPAVVLLAICFSAHAQQNRIKASVILLPMSFGTGTIAYERLNKTLHASWQINFSVAAGAVASDAEHVNRKWVTAEKTFYTGKPANLRFMYSFFVEAGSRIRRPGFIHPPDDSIPQSTKGFEFCPGISIGMHYNISKHFGVQLFSGPKLVYGKSETRYYDAVGLKYFSVNEGNKLSTGLRFGVLLFYQF